jgi:hypothetical protein
MALTLLNPDVRIEVRDTDLPGVNDPKDGVVYTIRQITRAASREIELRHTKRVANPQTRAMDAVVDQDALYDDLIDYALIAWAGVNFEDGTPAPCDRQCKVEGLDALRKQALLVKAGTNRSAGEVRAESFRPTS